MNDYELQTDRIVQKVRDNDYKSVLLQFPEGMLDEPLNQVQKVLSDEGIQVYTAGDPSYGVCDLAIALAKRLNCDLLIHFGHSEFGFHSQVSSVQSDLIDIMIIPAYYVPPQELDYNSLIDEIRKKKWKTIGLASTIQHIKSLDKLEEKLTEYNFQIIRYKEGQILGCNVHSLQIGDEKCDGFVSIHAGYFHTHGILLNTSKPLMQFNPYSGGIKTYGEEEHTKVIRQRFTLLTKVRNIKKWGIIGSSKLGQLNQNMIGNIQSLLSERKLESLTVVAENINPQMLSNFTNIEAWVVTACPRIAIDDKIRYLKPIITFKEFLYLFHQLKWEDLLEHGFF